MDIKIHYAWDFTDKSSYSNLSDMTLLEFIKNGMKHDIIKVDVAIKDNEYEIEEEKLGIVKFSFANKFKRNKKMFVSILKKMIDDFYNEIKYDYESLEELKKYFTIQKEELSDINVLKSYMINSIEFNNITNPIEFTEETPEKYFKLNLEKANLLNSKIKNDYYTITLTKKFKITDDIEEEMIKQIRLLNVDNYTIICEFSQELKEDFIKIKKD